jgi:hypothetical protein
MGEGFDRASYIAAADRSAAVATEGVEFVWLQSEETDRGANRIVLQAGVEQHRIRNRSREHRTGMAHVIELEHRPPFEIVKEMEVSPNPQYAASAAARDLGQAKQFLPLGHSRRVGKRYGEGGKFGGRQLLVHQGPPLMWLNWRYICTGCWVLSAPRKVWDTSAHRVKPGLTIFLDSGR